MKEETFYPLKGYEYNFEISKKGTVRNIKTGNVLKSRIKRDYYIVDLNFDSKKKRINLSRLLAETFIENPDNYKYVCFKDGNKLNYKLDNLEWSNTTNKNGTKVPAKIKPGTKYGEFTVIEDKGMIHPSHPITCKCSCGVIKDIAFTVLNKGYVTDCGHVNRDKITPLNITSINNRILKEEDNKRYIIEEISSERNRRGDIKRKIKIKCKYCGDESIRSYQRFLKEGKNTCNNCAIKNKTIGRSKIHGKSNHPLQSNYQNMKSRCYRKENKDYKNYGGRGIKICNEWLNSFESFYNWSVDNGWEYGLTIERKDNNGNYEPSNCKWASRADQNRNTRATKLDWDKIEVIRSGKYSDQELADMFGVSRSNVATVRCYGSWNE